MLPYSVIAAIREWALKDLVDEVISLPGLIVELNSCVDWSMKEKRLYIHDIGVVD